MQFVYRVRVRVMVMARNTIKYGVNVNELTNNSLKCVKNILTMKDEISVEIGVQSTSLPVAKADVCNNEIAIEN